LTLIDTKRNVVPFAPRAHPVAWGPSWGSAANFSIVGRVVEP
jgi:hypothetical protein